MTDLKWSRFNFLVETEKHRKYLYNSYSNSLIALDDSLYASLLFLSRDNGTSILSAFSEEEIEYLKKIYALVEDDDALVDILHHQSMSRLYSKKTMVLTIAPTQSCNFACTYCFEKWRQSGALSNRNEDAIINYIKHLKQEDGLESVNLTWYGGEPLLQYKRVISLARRIDELGLKINENLLITNGYFFTPEVVEKLVEAKISEIQITLDGFRETHDIRRPLINGKGTFDTIIKNLDDYYNSRFRGAFAIAIRVNIDNRNYKSFMEIYRWLNDRYKSKKLIVYPGIVVLDETDCNASTCLSRNAVTDIFLDLFTKYGVVTEELYPDDVNMECMTRSPYSMLIGSQGEIYKCYEDLGNKELTVGNINDPEVWHNYELIAKYAVGIDHYNDPECRKCSYLPICRGGCPIRRFENVYKGKHNDCCTPFKGRIKDYIELYSKILND